MEKSFDASSDYWVDDRRWIEIKERIKKKWVKLSDDEIESLRNNRGGLRKKIIKKYGFSDDFATREVDIFMKGIESVAIKKDIEKENPNIEEMKNAPDVGQWYG
jgi:hypothetical protein